MYEPHESHDVVDATPAERLAAEALSFLYLHQTHPWDLRASEGLHAVLQEGDLERIALLMQNHRLLCASKSFRPSSDGKYMERIVDERRVRRETKIEKDNAISLAELNAILQTIVRQAKLDDLREADDPATSADV